MIAWVRQLIQALSGPQEVEEGTVDVSVERYLIVGLGNPGRQYIDTRHYIGFMCVDALAAAYGLKFDSKKSKAVFADGTVAHKRVILAKPQTYMNESGFAVKGLVNFYQIPLERLVVISDDLDIPLGTLRIRPKGGAGGQKGVRNTIQQLGNEEFMRIRVGIGRPPGKMDAAAYVLQPFLPADQPLVLETIDRVIKALEDWLREGIDYTMNRHNGTAEEAAARFAKSEAPPTTDNQS